ncbi:hypothetical protein HELRODRAFT_80430 [Helobdella robusta]|uniref:Malectin domain-containing protein n=1 Tax=Helobdella robusta TaxID=6412 RepID=T1G406_HELRO|nr:hypothetical protein HELRODRAFT_80430 [Helobdella robusta]ESO03433.1 hypothetical protein HELRODRAFT_80430 [Helobdella robusta]
MDVLGRRLCLHLESRYFIFLIALILHVTSSHGIGEIIYAVNCGGGAHVDVYGIHYQKDPLNIGVPSDHGKVLTIRRAPPPDQILYQTERYHTSNFAYSVPIRSDGDYVLVMKFSEVWFTEPNRKIFDVQMNDHIVVDHLDIFATVGLGVAHDEIIPFSVKNGILTVNKEASTFNGVLNIEFVKLMHDNPKVNAIYIMKGSVDDLPLLPPLQSMEHQHQYNEDDEEEEMMQQDSSSSRHQQSNQQKRRRPVSELKVSDPYASEDPSSMLLPVIIAVAAFVPIVFCLCRL